MNLDLYVVLSSKLASGRSLEDVVCQALQGGARVFQLREKTMSTRELVATARRLGEIIHQAGGTLIINDRADVALVSGADGVHVGQSDMSPADVRKIVGNDRIVGVSVSSVEEAILAQQEGADYLGAGAVFATTTKPDASVIGLNELRKICKTVNIPVVAIGGITIENIDQVMASGAGGIAVVSAVVSAPDCAEASRTLLTRVLAAKKGR